MHAERCSRLLQICVRAAAGLLAWVGLTSPTAILAADHMQGDWPTAGRDAEGSYHSPLAAINAGNIGELGFAWQYPLGTTRGLEATPLVVDGVLFTSGNWGRVYALDAATGRELWTFIPRIDGQWGRYACCDVVNRGVALSKGHVYVGALDGFLYSLDARTGQVVWKVDTLLSRGASTPYTVTGAPLIAGDMVVIGNSGADFGGVRGYVSAFSLATGALRWRFFTVPRNPALGSQDQAHLEHALSTWNARYDWRSGGGGTVWDGLAFDESAQLIYIGTDNAAPYDVQRGSRDIGDDLYISSIVALHAGTGTLAWYYQEVPQEHWDYGATQKFVLAGLNVRGRPRAVIMQAAKDGFFYVLERITGELLSAKNFVFVNWTRGIDPSTHRPLPDAAADYLSGPKLIYPGMAGAHNWQPMSYDSASGLVFIPAFEQPMVYVETSKLPAGPVQGTFTVTGVAPEDYAPKAMARLYGVLPPLDALAAAAGGGVPRSRSVLVAFDPLTGRTVWQQPSSALWDGGVLSTAGDLVLRGTIGGALEAYAAHDGRHLRSIDVGTSIMAAPMTYVANGKQYVAVMAGFGGGGSTAFPPRSAAYTYGNQGRIIALALGGAAVPKPAPFIEPPVPAPPPREGSPAVIGRGEILYNRYCSRCHVFGRGALPDLRRMSPATHQIFYRIVLAGAYADKGMGRWDDVLSEADARAIHAFIVDQSWGALAAP
jgi:quinohemoprotein ethanol dehydrogenase